LKTLKWSAVGSTYPQTWEREMRAIKEVNDDAFKHLVALPSKKALILVLLLMSDLKSNGIPLLHLKIAGHMCSFS